MKCGASINIQGGRELFTSTRWMVVEHWWDGGKISWVELTERSSRLRGRLLQITKMAESRWPSPRCRNHLCKYSGAKLNKNKVFIKCYFTSKYYSNKFLEIYETLQIIWINKVQSLFVYQCKVVQLNHWTNW